jgi:DNA polymerase III sliding clamp (beta) subunit (PCNA family)
MKTIRIIKSETTFAFPVADLIATYAACSKEETRYYLQGVYVEPRDGGVRLVATNGHILLRTDSEGFAPAEPIILSTDVMEKAFKAKGKNPWVYGDTATGIIQVISYDESAEDHPRLGVCEFTVIDGTFPDYTRVIPERKSGFECACFDPNLIATLHKAGSVFDKSYTMRLTAEDQNSPMLVDFSHVNHMIGVLMPRRFQ